MYTCICKYNAQRAATLAACNDAANGSCPLSADEVRDRGSPNREWKNTSQGLLVTHREVQLTQSFRVTGAGFTFARSAGAPGDQNAVSPDEIYIYIYGNPLQRSD